MTITDAQQDLSRAYVGGGPGVVVSSIVWMLAAWVQHTQGTAPGFAALFVGGMLIYPAGKLICRGVFGRENEASANPFGMTVLECTLAMMGGLFAAWLLLGFSPDLVFPVAAIAVGTHYFVFKTAYGDRTFWLLASAVTAIGVTEIYVPQMQGWAAPLVSFAELCFGVTLTIRYAGARKTVNSPA